MSGFIQDYLLGRVNFVEPLKTLSLSWLAPILFHNENFNIVDHEYNCLVTETLEEFPTTALVPM